MNRILVLLFGIVILNGCAQSTSFVGPSYTFAKSGSVIQAGNSVAMSYGFKKILNQTDANTMITSHTWALTVANSAATIASMYHY